jgi:high-affinity iron transporter
MLTTFVIGLREGLEAALVVGIIAAFIIRRGDRRVLRSMWLGVAAALVVSAAGAVALHVANRALTLQARETMEGVLTLLAVVGVSYMIVWMRRHSATLRTELEAKASAAFAAGSGTAIGVLAFVAVAREGLETAVFLLAILGNSAAPALAASGAAAGIGVSVMLGYGIYRGGVAVDLRRFFRLTGIVLVIVAAGLVSSAVHELAEAGVIDVLQSPAIDLSWLITADSVWSSILAAFVGFQPVPTVAETVAWAAFLVPMTLYVGGARFPRRRRRLAA